MKHLFRFSLVPGALLLAIAAAFGVGIASRGGVAEAAYPAADSITMTQVCASDGTISLTVNWVTYNQGYQWVDMSSGSSFAPGTFTSSMQLPANQNSYVWNSALAATPYYLRVNTQSYGGAWYSSPVMYFTTMACANSYGTNSYGSSSYGSSYSSMGYGGQPMYISQPMYQSFPVIVKIIRVPVFIRPAPNMHNNMHNNMHHR